MMGYLIVVGECFVCREIFAFNPHFVPSMRVRFDGDKAVPDPASPRAPICRACIAEANRRRKERGLDPHPIHPRAYEATPEGDL